MWGWCLQKKKDGVSVGELRNKGRPDQGSKREPCVCCLASIPPSSDFFFYLFTIPPLGSPRACVATTFFVLLLVLQWFAYFPTETHQRANLAACRSNVRDRKLSNFASYPLLPYNNLTMINRRPRFLQVPSFSAKKSCHVFFWFRNIGGVLSKQLIFNFSFSQEVPQSLVALT